MNDTLRILIADDDDIIREGLSTLLNHQDGISVCASVTNGSEALIAIASTPIDVALLDVNMPILDGIALARILAEKYPEVTVVMLTAFEHEDALAHSLAAHVRGFLTKDIPADQLAVLIKQAHAGMTVMSPKPTYLVTDAYIKNQVHHEEYREFIDIIEGLPHYLRAVFDLVIQAKPNKTIARELHLSETTVRAYISALFSATGFTNRGELTITAIKAGY